MSKKKLEPGMAYDTKKLNKIFAFISIAFLATVIWLFLKDYLRPWKAVQLEAIKIKKTKVLADLKKAEGAINKEKLEALENKLTSGEETVASRKMEISKVQKTLDVLVRDIKAETIVNGRLNSNVSATNFKWEQAHSPNGGPIFNKLKKYKKEFASSSDRMKRLQFQEKALKKEILGLNKEVLSTQKEIKGLVGKRDLLKMALKKTEMGPVFALRNSPMIDFMDPTLKIQQIVIENITDDRYFQHVPKVDRCITCHTFISEPGYEDQPNPHRTHPNLDLMVGIKSKHPMKQYGCTSCHGGEGHRVYDFNAPAHTPQNKEQATEWAEKHHWHAPHKVPQVQYKKGMTEAGCVKCHSDVQYIPGATVLNEGRRNIEKFGCYGCHKIKGWEHKRKPGPSLEKIASKVSKEFFKNWVWSPKSFNKHAKMPAFFDQINNNKPEYQAKNIAEVNAMAEFIWSNSKDYKPFMKYKGGDVAKGKELVKSVGCMGCHGADDFPKLSEKVDAYKGPHLSGTGSKVDADWLVSWLKKPSHYQEDTIMPSFRLTDKEANDMTAYLMSLKNKKFEELKFEGMNGKLRDEILVTYFSAFDTVKVAKAKLAAMSDKERTHELGRRSIGKYGCYSCHSIDGFEGRAPIGPELSNIGSKPLTQFGFSHEYDVEHSRDGWIKAHLQSPRRWDNGIDKAFKDLLRMPNFDMNDKDAKSITVALIGQVSDKIPLEGIKKLDAHEAVVAEGMKVAIKYNCIGCHQIDGMFGDILGAYEDDINEGPPRLVGQGHRVKSDWFYYFLGNVFEIRPWLNVRMPSFNLSSDEKNKLVAMFQAKEKQVSFSAHEKVTWLPGEKKAAKKLWEELACASCHTGGFNSDEPQAPDLHHAKRRLRTSWIKKWLRDPQKIMEGTLMPSFWEDGESSAPEILGGDSEKQIEAMTKLILEMGDDKLQPPMKK